MSTSDNNDVHLLSASLPSSPNVCMQDYLCVFHITSTAAYNSTHTHTHTHNGHLSLTHPHTVTVDQPTSNTSLQSIH